MSVSIDSFRYCTNSDLWALLLFGLGPLLGLVVFSVRRALQGNKSVSERVRQAGGSFILSSHVKEYGYWCLHLPTKALVALKVHPTTITLGGTAIVMGGSALVACGFFGLGGLAILLGSLSDMLDGLVARRLGLSSTAGEFIDSLVDRYADVAVYAGLMAFFLNKPWVCAVIGLAAVGTMLVSYARAKAESLGVCDVPKGPMQRAERAVLLGFSIFFSPTVARHTGGEGTVWWLAIGICALIAVLANVSAISMARYTIKTLRERHDTPQDPTQMGHKQDGAQASTHVVDAASPTHA